MRKNRQTTRARKATPALIAAMALLGASLGVSAGGEAMAQGSKSPKGSKPFTGQTNPDQGLSKKPQTKQADPKKPPVQQDVNVNKTKSLKKIQDQNDAYIKQ